jgi:hypothetical protein
MARTKIDKALLDLSGVLPLTGGTLNGSLAFTSTSTQGITGATTNDSAAAGKVGEYIESVVGSTSFAASGNYGDLTSISLTAGDWDVTAIGAASNSGTTWSQVNIGISVNGGNSGTGLVNGSSQVFMLFANSSTAITDFTLTVPVYRISLSTTTTIFSKMLAVYTGGTAKLMGRLSARRMR